MSIEQPDRDACVEFLSEGVGVTLTVLNGKLEITARMSHGENASTWDQYEVAWPIPERVADTEPAAPDGE